MKTYYLSIGILLIILTACAPGRAGGSAVTQSPSFTPTFRNLEIIATWTALPSFTLAPTNSPTCTQTSTLNAYLKYTVKSNDTCSSICQAYGMTLADFYQLNPDLKSNCFNLKPGQEVTVSLKDLLAISTDIPITLKTPTPILLKTQALPTWTIAPTRLPAPTQPPAPTQKVCCKVCTTSQACGDSCISKTKTCHQPPGCACNG